MKRLFIYYLSLFCISLVITNCDKEDIVVEHHHKKSPYEVPLGVFKDQTKIYNLNSYLKKLTPKNDSRNTASLTFEDFDIDTTLVKSFLLSENRTSFSFRLTLKENAVEGENYNLFIRQIDDEWFSSIFLFVDDNDSTNDIRFSSITEMYTEEGMADNLFRGVWAETTHYHCTNTGSCASGVCDLCYLCVSTSSTYISFTSQGDFGEGIEGSDAGGYSDGGVYNEGGGGGGSSSSSTPDIPCDYRDLNGDCLYNTLDFVLEIENCLGDQFSDDDENWLNNTATLEQVMQIRRYLSDALCSPDVQDFILEAIDVYIENENANPFIGADCRSFEYAQPPGALQRGCAVEDMDITFYTAGVRPNGSPYYGEIDINTSLIYFTAPSWMTNSQAANATAIAVTAAIDATRLHFYENPDISEYQLGDIFNNNLTIHMGLIGGTASFTQPFPIPSPAPFISNFFGAATDC